MKKIAIAVALLLGFTTHILSDEIDLDKKEGIDQDIIVSLDPTPASITVDENHTLQATFKIELQPKPISMQEVKLTKLEEEPKSSGIGSMFHTRDSKNKTINGEISYSTDKNSILFKADNPLDIGYYEVEFRRLIPKFNPTTMPMDYKRIKTIKYRFYVPEVINGHMLPPEPDKEKNDATVLGIDRNENEVRDDVERWIYHNYENPLEQAVLMQSAYAYQKVIEDPSEAHETVKYSDDALSCEFYLNRKSKVRYYSSIKKMRKIELNTLNRHLAYHKYNSAFHGEILSSPKPDKEKCNFDVDALLGGE